MGCKGSTLYRHVSMRVSNWEKAPQKEFCNVAAVELVLHNFHLI